MPSSPPHSPLSSAASSPSHSGSFSSLSLHSRSSPSAPSSSSWRSFAHHPFAVVMESSRTIIFSSLALCALFVLLATFEYYQSATAIRTIPTHTIVQIMPHPDTRLLSNSAQQQASDDAAPDLDTNAAQGARLLGAGNPASSRRVFKGTVKEDEEVHPTVVPPLPAALYDFSSGTYVNNSVGRVDTELCSNFVKKPPVVAALVGQGKWCRVEDVAGSPHVLWHGFWSTDGDGRPGFLSPPLTASSLGSSAGGGGGGGPGSNVHASSCVAPYRTPWAVTILAIPHGVVCGHDGTIFNNQSIYTLGWWHFRLPGDPDLPLRATEVITPAVFSLSMIWSDQFQHFVFDTLSRIAFSMDFLRKHPHVKILHNGGVNEAFLTALGFDQSRLVQAKPDVMYSSPMVYMPFMGHTHMGLVPPGIFKFVKQQLVPHHPPKAQRTNILYLRRPFPQLDRSIVPDNEAALLSALRKSILPPYQLVVFESAGDWRKDRAAFAGAAAVLGPHGGAFSNIVFCAPGTPVIEFLPYCRIHRIGMAQSRSAHYVNARPCFHGLAHGANLSHWFVEPLVFDFMKSGMIVDPDDVQRILAELGMAQRPTPRPLVA